MKKTITARSPPKGRCNFKIIVWQLKNAFLIKENYKPKSKSYFNEQRINKQKTG